jgi:5,10-methylenetetrahydromethanopterin reductase
MNMPIEYWTSAFGTPSVFARTAVEYEGDGWDGVRLGESPNRLPDSFSQLVAAALATTSIRLGTGVTNPATRLAVSTAAGIATVQTESSGRASLGIGRGDSSHICLGLAPAPLPVFARYIRRVRQYLDGEVVPVDPADGGGLIPSIEGLGLESDGLPNSLQWLPADYQPVPVDVAASGPRVIDLAAGLVDHVSFAVGAELGRLRWAIERCKEARIKSGLSLETLSFGAYVPIMAHPDRELARARIRSTVASFARMSLMHPGQTASGVTAGDVGVYERIRDDYEVSGHFQHRVASAQAASLPEEFVDRFGVAGPASYCADRLAELVELGLDRLYLTPPPDLTVDAIHGRSCRDEASAAEQRLLIGRLHH